jgi:hypothetical protein
MTNYRPGRRALPALVFLAALGVAGQAFGGDASGLAWPSGAREAGPESCLAAMRKRPLDVRMTFADHGSWSRLESFLASPWWKKMIRSAPTGVVSLALLTDDHARDWSECNSGKFDSEYSKIGSILAQSGARNLIIRLGWEANTAGSHAWVPAQGDIGAFKQCWIRARNIINSKLGSVSHKFEQSLAKNGAYHINQMTYWVGKPYADILGVHYYNSGFVATTDWAKASESTNPAGGPQGRAVQFSDIGWP